MLQTKKDCSQNAPDNMNMYRVAVSHRREWIMAVIALVAIAVLSILPTGFEKQIYFRSESVAAEILDLNNNAVYSVGMFKQGEQRARIRILNGKSKGQEVDGVNLLNGSLTDDKIFHVGERARVLIDYNEQGKLRSAFLIDHDRVPAELLLIAVFAIAMIIFAGGKGVRTLISFAFALLCIWKLLIPMSLSGFQPLLVALMTGCIITVVTILMVSGFNRASYAAILSSILAAIATGMLAYLFANVLRIDGTTLPWAESLLYAGMNLDLRSLFQAAIYLSCSGAILDLAVDIASALHELEWNQPDISRVALLRAGLSIGRTVVGSQTTTLLLAYMGSYLSVMMVYMAQGTPMIHIFSMKAIGAEILNTFVGCLGLVLVSPLTSMLYALLHHRAKASDQDVDVVEAEIEVSDAV